MIKLTITVHQSNLPAFEKYLMNNLGGIIVDGIIEYGHAMDFNLSVTEDVFDKIEEYSC